MKYIFVLLGLFFSNQSVIGQSWGDSTVKAGPVFHAVETPPKFPGGSQAYYTFMANNLVVPEGHNGVMFKKTVAVDVYLNIFGKVTFAEVKKGIDEGFNIAALDLIKKMPDWTPAKQNDRPVPVVIPLYITFID